MRTITLKIPENLDISSNELVFILAGQLFEDGKLSLGQAAELAGLTTRTFAELLGKANIPTFNYPGSDLPRDVANA